MFHFFGGKVVFSFFHSNGGLVNYSTFEYKGKITLLEGFCYF